MADASTTVNLCATRWKPFLAAIAFAGAIVVDLLFYFVWPTPAISMRPWMYQEPAKTLLFIVVFLIGTIFVLLGLYWTVTPIPMVQLSESCLVYHPFPLPTRTINWVDVAHILAVAERRDTSLYTRATFLTCWFTLKPRDNPINADPQQIDIDINLGNLPLHAEELVRLIRNYHDVQFRSDLKHPKARRQSRRRSQP